jgi:hypothetical protein
MIEGPGREYLKTRWRECSVAVLYGVKCRQVSHEFAQYSSLQPNVAQAAQQRGMTFKTLPHMLRISP